MILLSSIVYAITVDKDIPYRIHLTNESDDWIDVKTYGEISASGDYEIFFEDSGPIERIYYYPEVKYYFIIKKENPWVLFFNGNAEEAILEPWPYPAMYHFKPLPSLHKKIFQREK